MQIFVDRDYWCIEETRPEAHSPDRLTSNRSSVSEGKKRPQSEKTFHIQVAWAGTLIMCNVTEELPDCFVPLFSQAICQSYCISLGCARTHAPACGTPELCLKMFFPLAWAFYPVTKSLIESGLQRQMAWGGRLAVGAVIQQLACFYSQRTKDIISKSAIKQRSDRRICSGNGWKHLKGYEVYLWISFPQNYLKRQISSVDEHQWALTESLAKERGQTK